VDSNWLKVTTPPFHYASKHRLPEPTTSMRFDATPWIGITVTITGNHAYKGYHGIIRDVFCNRTTSSGLGFQVELLSSPPKMEIFDFDNVLEASYVVTFAFLVLQLTI